MSRIFLVVLCALLLSSCLERKIGVSLKGFNHTDNKYIGIFYVNGVMGPNIMPRSGGGKSTCCVSLPFKWRPGMRVKISWEYEYFNQASPIQTQTLEMEVPKYERAGDFHVHFYEEGRIKLVVSSCLPGHPFYPMDEQSLLPWKPDSTKEDHLKWQKETGSRHGC